MKLTWRYVELGNGPTINTSLTNNETTELQKLAQNKHVLEVGSAYGYSAIAMALAGAKKVTAVDPHAWLPSLEAMQSNINAHGVDHTVEIVQQWSFDALESLYTSRQQFDLIFIDGDHEAHAVQSDVTLAEKLLAPNGILACHDYDEETCPGVRIALDAWKPFNYIIDTLAVYTNLKVKK